MGEESMNMKYLAILTALGISCNAAFAADEYLGRTIASACFGCHGTSSAAIPPIILGAPSEYIEISMKAFRDGSRPSTIMQRIAKGYTDEEIAAVAQYLSTKGGE
ncbi:MAG: cytochrome C [Gammaproteobacteria bacterium]|nr:cytochrome C [Gammaproteobacteria bacterium]